MSNTLHLTATVLPGHRIEIASPQLPVGEKVDLVVKLPRQSTDGTLRPKDILEFLDSLPPNSKTAAEWEQFDRDFKEEKRSWVL